MVSNRVDGPVWRMLYPILSATKMRNPPKNEKMSEGVVSGLLRILLLTQIMTVA